MVRKFVLSNKKFSGWWSNLILAPHHLTQLRTEHIIIFGRLIFVMIQYADIGASHWTQGIPTEIDGSWRPLRSCLTTVNMGRRPAQYEAVVGRHSTDYTNPSYGYKHLFMQTCIGERDLLLNHQITILSFYSSKCANFIYYLLVGEKNRMGLILFGGNTTWIYTGIYYILNTGIYLINLMITWIFYLVK